MVEGLTTIRSSFGATETMDRLEAGLRDRGVTIFARIDHGAGAREVGLSLRPVELLIFGSARTGTLLMQSRETTAIDLPLKAIVWQDAAGKTWLSYNDPAWLAARHRLGAGTEATVTAMTDLLNAAAQQVTGAH